MTKRGDRVAVVLWRDAHGTGSEDARADVLKEHQPMRYWSAGILVLSDEAGVTLAMDQTDPAGEIDEPRYRQRTFIPRELIDQERDLGCLQKRRRCAETRRRAENDPLSLPT